MAEPAAVSIVIPAFNEAAAIAAVVAALAARGAVARDHRRRRRLDATTPARSAAAAGATVVRHPYNKGNGAAVKSGIRARHRRVRPDRRRRRPAQAGGRAAAGRRGSANTTSSSARDRAARRRRTPGAFGNARAQPARQLPDRTRDPGPDVGLPRRPPRVPARVPAPAAERLLDADDDDAGVHQGRLQRRLRAGRRAAAGRHVEDPARARRPQVLPDHPEDRDDLQPAAGLPADLASSSFALGVVYGVWNVAMHSRIPNGSVLLILFAVVSSSSAWCPSRSPRCGSKGRQ